MLTKRQKQILDYLEGFIDKNDYAPSLKEIARHFKLSSASTVHQHLETLKEKGYLKKISNQPRGIEPKTKDFELVEIPLLGIIAAGSPIEAIEDKENITVQKSLLSKSGIHYALRVKGNSMIEDGINDGDTVIIRKQNTADNGETVVGLINGNEVTLKRIFKEKNGFRLQPANPSLRPLFVKDLVIQGKVVSVIRNLENLKYIQDILETEQKEKIENKEFEFDRIICGDVLETMQTIPDNSVHLAITSPPYNVGKEYDSHFDRMNYNDYLSWLEKVWKETKRVLVPGGRFCLNIAPTGIKDFKPLHHDFSNQLRNLGMIMRTEIVWYKQTMLKRTAWGSWKSPANPHIVPSWEYVLVFSKDKSRLDGDYKDADINKEEFMKFSDGFWQIWPETQRNGHPSPFPEELIYRLIKFYSYRGNIVLDMFGGTGTVAAVAYKTGRHYLHIDISKEYCKIAEKRIATLKKQPDLFVKPTSK